MTDELKPECIPIDDDDANEPEEYSVECIRGKRKNASTGVTEYLIKWEGWPESDNSWEPIDNLECPALIAEFEAEEKKKRKLRSASKPRQKKVINSQNLRSAGKDSHHANGQAASSFLMENENADEISDITLPSTTAESSNLVENQQPTKDLTESTWHQPKGFARGKPVQEIVGSVVDDKNKLCFFVRWKDCPEIELVDANEMEDKAPKKLCKWYRERLYFTIKTQSNSQIA